MHNEAYCLPTIEFKGKSSSSLVSVRYACKSPIPNRSNRKLNAVNTFDSSRATSLDKCKYSSNSSNCDDSDSSKDSSALSLPIKEEGDPFGKDVILTVPPYFHTPTPPDSRHSW